MPPMVGETVRGLGERARSGPALLPVMLVLRVGTLQCRLASFGLRTAKTGGFRDILLDTALINSATRSSMLWHTVIYPS